MSMAAPAPLLSVKGLVKQHIDSFNFFVEHEIKEIVKANRRIGSDVDGNFYLEFVHTLKSKACSDNLLDIQMFGSGYQSAWNTMIGGLRMKSLRTNVVFAT